MATCSGHAMTFGKPYDLQSPYHISTTGFFHLCSTRIAPSAVAQTGQQQAVIAWLAQRSYIKR